jgi:hypothetical protein
MRLSIVAFSLLNWTTQPSYTLALAVRRGRHASPLHEQGLPSLGLGFYTCEGANHMPPVSYAESYAQKTGHNTSRNLPLAYWQKQVSSFSIVPETHF